MVGTIVGNNCRNNLGTIVGNNGRNSPQAVQAVEAQEAWKDKRKLTDKHNQVNQIKQKYAEQNSVKKNKK